MFEKWRIKEHMDVVDAAGRHIGTIDTIDGDTIKLTRSDAADGVHHYLDVKWVDRIEDNRAYTKPGTPLDAASKASGETEHFVDPPAAGDVEFATSPDPMQTAVQDAGRPLFGTSGHGTGMGGGGID